MKKLASLFLVLTMLLSLLTACVKVGSTPVDIAAKYVQSMYKEDDGSVTPEDYKVVGVVTIDKTTFQVTWSTDNAEVKVVPDADGKMVTIDVNEESPAKVDYTLTATVKDASGNTASCSFKHTVPEYKVSTISEVLAMEDGAAVVLSGTVTAIDTAWSDSYGNISVYISDDAGNKILLYRLSTKVELGDVILVKGTVGSYNGSKQIAQGATATITDHVEITIDYAEKTIAEILTMEDGVDVMLKNVTVTSIDTAWSDSYGNISVYVEDSTGASILLYRLGTNVAVGDVLTVKAAIASYEGTKQLKGGSAVITGKETVTVEYVEKTIAEILTMEDGANVMLKDVVVTSIDTAWNEGYGNISVFVKDSTDASILLYRLGTNVAVGDVLTVKAAVASYNSVKQLKGGSAVITGHQDLPGGDETPADATISFEDDTIRTERTDTQQTWVQNSITFVNQKASSTNNIIDSKNPVRCYKGSNITVSYTGMKKVVINMNSNYCSGLQGITLTGATITVDGTVATIVFENAVDTFTIENLSAQIRIYKIEIYK